MTVNSILIIVLVFILLILARLFIPRWRIKRAAHQVIRIFRAYNAIGIKNAKTVDELGLKPRAMLEMMFRGRDYKQYALSALMKAEIIKRTEDEKLYLLEDKLAASSLEKGASYYR